MNAWQSLLQFHGMLVADRRRVEAFRRAIDATVKPDDVVIDVGTGTGILAVLACRAGAARVYAIDDSDAIDIARDVCAANGVLERVVLVRGSAERVDLPERGDVLVTETLGNFGIDEGIAGVVLDARTRLLKPDARIVPHALDIMMAPVTAPDVYLDCVERWAEAVEGIDVGAVRSLAANTFHSSVFANDARLADPARIAHVPLAEITNVAVHGETSWRARAGTLHGFAGWFAADLAPGVQLSNATPSETPNWAHAFVPLEHPVRVEAAQEVCLTLSARANGTVWYWNVAVGGREIAAQSTLWGTAGLRHRLGRGAATHVPTLARAARAELDVLGRIDGRRSIRELRDVLLREHPDLFRSPEAAEAFVHEIIARCGA
jgi:type I protein arginine methyltransferase